MKKAFLILLLSAVLLAGCTLPHRADPTPTTEVTQATEAPTTEAPTTEPTEPVTETTAPTEPEALTVVSTATLAATGDLLMHLPVINSGKQSDGSYSYENIFRYLAPYTRAADYAVVNLETTLCGTDHGYPYAGYPKFNCPDSIVDSAAEAGFDMILTANNHCNDTGTRGFNRTLQVIANRGLASLGTTATAEEPNYRVVEVNGISLGLVCYTYTIPIASGEPNVNGLPLTGGTAERINLFDYENLDAFYSRLSGQMAAMKDAGADAIVLFIHWGEEYRLHENNWQRSIAQSLCDLGVDVIIGNHPHVVQPVELLTAADDPNRKTICLYSMGNAVSNQRKGSISALKSAHTEDGVLVRVTFARFSDGSVAPVDVDALPLWVNRHSTSQGREYNILPLNPKTRDDWRTLYGLTKGALSDAGDSYDRTLAQLGEGLEECQTYLAEARAQREADYLAAQAQP